MGGVGLAHLAPACLALAALTLDRLAWLVCASVVGVSISIKGRKEGAQKQKAHIHPQARRGESAHT